MSRRTAREAEKVLSNLLKAKGVSKEVIGNINRAESDASRLLSLVSQLARGDITSLVGYLAGLGPYGVAAAVAIGVGAVAYGVYQQATRERPAEVYLWRYPK